MKGDRWKGVVAFLVLTPISTSTQFPLGYQEDLSNIHKHNFLTCPTGEGDVSVRLQSLVKLC